MKRRIQIIIIGCLTALIVAGFGFLAIKESQYSGVVEIPTYRSDNGSGFAKPFILNVVKNKQWDEKPANGCLTIQHYGAQYDFIATNTLGYKIDTWSMQMIFTSQIIVDSYWNCVYTLDQNSDGNYILTLSTDKASSIIEENNTEKFGAVIHGVNLPESTECQVRFFAREYKTITDYPLFWILVISAALLIFSVFVQIGIFIRTRQFRAQKKHDEEFIVQSINTFVNFIDAKDPYTKGHSTRVALYSREIAERLHMSEEDRKNLYFIALMHDVGKISIPDSVLQKPGRLTPEERKIIESHTTVGATMLRDFNALPGIVSGALYHHERYDGSGYPQGLAGEDIPVFARIICVADSYDAMSSRRCYRSKLSLEEILRELNVNSGKQFDPNIVKHMVAMLEEAKAAGRLSHYNL